MCSRRHDDFEDKCMLCGRTKTEVGDLFYDAKTDLLWVTDSEAFKLFVFDGDVTKVKAIYDISFIGNPESVCVDHDRNCVWMADDGSTSKIYKIAFTGL